MTLFPLPSYLRHRFPIFWAPWTDFVEDNFSTVWGGGKDDLGMIKVHYVYCAIYFYYHYISSASGNQALDPRG